MAEEKTTKKKTNSTTKKKVTKKETSTKKTTSKKTTPKKSNTASKTTSKKTPKKDVKETKKLEDTIRIRIDDDRVNDVESLDTSFIEGRKRKKVKEDSKEKEKILAEKKDYSKFFNIVKCIIYILAACCVIFLGVLALRKSDLFNKEIEPDDEIIEKEEEKDEEKVVLPDNYLFVGDFHTKGMDFEDFLYPFVKVSDLEYTTNDLLNNIEQDIYVYNPSAVFIQLGINDLNTEVEKEEIISNIEEIIKGIQSNRPYAKIYLESLYPIGEEIDEELELSEDITNKNIRNINAKLEKLADDLEVNYIDMYSELIDDNYLKESYTDDGFNLNEDGYKRVFKVINRIIEEADEKVK